MKKFKRILFFNLTTTLIVSFSFIALHAQSDLLEKKAQLTEEIRRVRKEIAEEKKQFESYRRQKENIISYKTKENQSLKEDIRNKTSDIRLHNRELLNVEANIINLKKQEQRINDQIRFFAVELQNEIDKGIPFEKSKRKAILSSLIYDIDNSNISANESFSRLIGFLNLEQAMSYDSQVIRTTMQIQGIEKDVNLLRLGRVFFAVDDGNAVYLWKWEKEQYVLNLDKIPLFEAQAIRSAEKIIQGKKVPELILMPFSSYQIEKIRSSR